MSSYTYDLDKKMRAIELGMDKSSVIAILRSTYKFVSAIDLDDNNRVEVWKYEGDSNGAYDIVFKDGKIVEWTFLKPPVPVKTESEVTILNKTDKSS